jgi:hypothetical protein
MYVKNSRSVGDAGEREWAASLPLFLGRIVAFARLPGVDIVNILTDNTSNFTSMS